MDTVEEIKQFQEYLKNAGCQAATIESYCRDLRYFFQFAQSKKIRLHQMEPMVLIEYQDYLKFRKEKDNSIRRAVISLRQYMRFKVKQKSLNLPKLMGSPFDAVAIPKRDERLPAQITGGQFLNLLQQAAHGSFSPFKKARDLALLYLMGVEGLKSSEVISLKWKQFIAPDSLLVHSPSAGRERSISLSPECSQALCTYRDHWKSHMHDVQAEGIYAFVGFKGRDAAKALPRLSRHGLKFFLYELGEKVGIQNLNGEMLRHHAISRFILLGKDPEDMKAHLGLKRLGNIAKHLHSQQTSTQVTDASQ